MKTVCCISATEQSRNRKSEVLIGPMNSTVYFCHISLSEDLAEYLAYVLLTDIVDLMISQVAMILPA